MTRRRRVVLPFILEMMTKMLKVMRGCPATRRRRVVRLPALMISRTKTMILEMEMETMMMRPRSRRRRRMLKESSQCHPPQARQTGQEPVVHSPARLCPKRRLGVVWMEPKSRCPRTGPKESVIW